MDKTIQIRGRSFTVSTTETKYGIRYTLRGTRGAEYCTMRNERDPSLMFLVHLTKGFGIPHGMEGVWLTDHGVPRTLTVVGS